MAEAQIANGVKRPHPPDGSQQDDQKRIRSNTGSPSVPANGVPGSKPDISKAVAEARARAQNAANRRNATQMAGINGAAAHSPSPGPDAPSNRPMSKIEEMKARVAALTSKSKAAAQPALSPFSPPPFDDAFSRQRGGLSAALHPSLLDAGKDAASKNASQPRYPPASKPTTKAPGKGKKQLDLTGPNIEEFRQNNPYFDSSLGGQTATLKTRNPKQLKFNEKGKYIQQAASMRRLEALEAMRKRIAASSKKALIEEDVAEKKFIIEPPPEIEWWDEGLVANTDKGYEDITSPNGLKIDSSDSIITRLIQHPALILPPADRLIPAPKPMYLTTQEQKKIRRQRRMANLKETQAKIRLGLQEPPPDKVKLGNLMRVLGTEAVKDPTAVEAQVTRQIAERKQGHEQMNEDRKLNKDEKHEKLETKQAADVAKGIYLSVYKIDSLANGRHRFKVGKNCEQLGGTGLCIYSPKFCLVLVEFGQHGARAYKKLMLNRIDWTENSPAPVREGNKEAQVAFLAAEDEKTGQVKDLGGNKCQLLFEGQEKDQMFRKWATKVCETEKEAMDALARTKMDTFWTMAKGMP